MTTSDTFGSYPPPPPAAGRRLLRRSRNNRVAAGVSSGLGDYFGVDPVLFRVLFATAAFFGGAGILAYLLAWAAIPDADTEHAPIDGIVETLRRRHIPVWLVALAGGVLLWVVAFSWWSPWPFFPVIAVVVLLVVFYGRHELRAGKPLPAGSSPVSLTKDDAPTTDQPAWVRDARGWLNESRQARLDRRRRTLPMRIAILGTLATALIVLGIIDAIWSIELRVYFWTALAIVVVGLLVATIARRLPFSMFPLLAPAIVGAIAFGGSHITLHDGVGQREWTPTATPSSSYRLAFGQGILDLRSLPARSMPGMIHVTMGAGQMKIIAPKTLNLTVLANVHIGQLDIDDNRADGHHHGHGGAGISRTVPPPSTATGTAITVDVHLADGQLEVDHR
jgi:phage shock protein PspC (stress-responsive transcriptional regulator)